MESILPEAECPDAVMTNFDHTIDQSVADRIKESGECSQYAGWNFCGYVWWEAEADQWACEIWQYNAVMEVIRADSLETIMAKVSNEYGSD